MSGSRVNAAKERGFGVLSPLTPKLITVDLEAIVVWGGLFLSDHGATAAQRFRSASVVDAACQGTWHLLD
jgi:hypothetical protein